MHALRLLKVVPVVLLSFIYLNLFSAGCIMNCHSGKIRVYHKTAHIKQICLSWEKRINSRDKKVTTRHPFNLKRNALPILEWLLYLIWLRLCDWCQSVLTTLQQQTTERLGFHSPTSTPLIKSDEMMMNCSAADTDIRLTTFPFWTGMTLSCKTTKNLYSKGGIILLSIHRDLRKQPYVMSDPSSFCKLQLHPHPSLLLLSTSWAAAHLVTVYAHTLQHVFFFQCFKLRKGLGVIHTYIFPSFSLSLSVTASVQLNVWNRWSGPEITHTHNTFL